MSAIVIPLRRKTDRRPVASTASTRGTTETPKSDATTILATLSGHRRELLAVIEGLRLEAVHGASANAALVSALDVLTRQALTNVDLLIHGAERMVATEHKP